MTHDGTTFDKLTEMVVVGGWWLVPLGMAACFAISAWISDKGNTK